MDTEKKPTWLLVDGTNIVHSDAFGTGPDRAAIAFGNRIKGLIDWYRPRCVFTAWDSGPSFRNELFPEYKGKRDKLPGIDKALRLAKEWCAENSVGVITAEGFEADDILATLSTKAVESGDRAMLYTGDKDLFQMLVAGWVNQIKHAKSRTLHKKIIGWDLDVVTAVKCLERYKVKPCQWVDYKCMVGDPSDNISGARGVGHKTAIEILKACKSLDSYYEDPSQIRLPKRQLTGMNELKPRLEWFRELVTLRLDVPIPSYCLESAYAGKAVA